MITKLVLDTEHARAGTPVAFLDFLPGDMAEVQLPDGKTVQVEAAAVDSHEPEESLTALAAITDIKYDTLVKAAREEGRRRRLLARKSGGVWLSTRSAVAAAGIRSRSRSKS